MTDPFEAMQFQYRVGQLTRYWDGETNDALVARRITFLGLGSPSMINPPTQHIVAHL